MEEWNQIRCRKSDPAYIIWPDYGCMLAVMAIFGCTQLDPAYLQGTLRGDHPTAAGTEQCPRASFWLCGGEERSDSMPVD